MKDAFRGRWRAVVIAVPVLAAIAAGVWFTSSADEEFEASGVLSITEFSNAATPAEIRAVLDDFDSSLGTREVAEIVRAAAPDGEARIQSEPFGEGGDVRITYVASRADEAELALDAGLREALTIISEAERRQLNRQLSAASALSGDAVEQLRGIEAEAGAADLAAEAARRSADLLTLRNQIAGAADDPAVRRALVAILEEKEAELALIDEQLLPWTSQRARFDLAVESAAATSLRLRQIAANQTDLRDAELLTSTRVVELSTTPDLVRVVVGAAAVAAIVVIAFALFAATQQARSGRRDDEDHDPAADPAVWSAASGDSPWVDRWLAGDGGDPASEIDEFLGLYGNAGPTSTAADDRPADRRDGLVDDAAATADDASDEVDESSDDGGAVTSAGSQRTLRKLTAASGTGSASEPSEGSATPDVAGDDQPETDGAEVETKPAPSRSKSSGRRSRSGRRAKRPAAAQTDDDQPDRLAGSGDDTDDDATD